MKKQDLGRLGEDLAVKELKRKGYRIVERNYRCRYGEIDVIGIKQAILVFIEVRARAGGSFGTPEESITRQKQDKLISYALEYINSHDNLPESWRIDFVAVVNDPQTGRPQRIEIIDNVIG